NYERILVETDDRAILQSTPPSPWVGIESGSPRPPRGSTLSSIVLEFASVVASTRRTIETRVCSDARLLLLGFIKVSGRGCHLTREHEVVLDYYPRLISLF
ncbi:hypothetical protein J2P12_06405, partial [Candidatus Bathyarchaeota archaeon]|nr:hypothetical protein [Candidatus Bathyarchaeota archaeon]